MLVLLFQLHLIVQGPVFLIQLLIVSVSVLYLKMVEKNLYLPVQPVVPAVVMDLVLQQLVQVLLDSVVLL